MLLTVIFYRLRSMSLGKRQETLSVDISESTEFGVAFVEYAIVASVLAFVMVGMIAYFQPGAELFFEQSTEGMFIPYPINFIPPP